MDVYLPLRSRRKIIQPCLLAAFLGKTVCKGLGVEFKNDLMGKLSTRSCGSAEDKGDCVEVECEVRRQIRNGVIRLGFSVWCVH